MSIRHEYVIDYLQEKKVVNDDEREHWGDETLAYFALVDVKERVKSELELDVGLRVAGDLQAVLNNTALLSMYLSDESEDDLRTAFINAKRVPPKKGYDRWAVESYQKYVKLLTAQHERNNRDEQGMYEWHEDHEMDLWNTIVDLAHDKRIDNATAQQLLLLFGLAETAKQRLTQAVVDTAIQQGSEKIRSAISFAHGSRIGRSGDKIRGNSVDEARIRSTQTAHTRESIDTLIKIIGSSFRELKPVEELVSELIKDNDSDDATADEARKRINSLIANGLIYLYGGEK